jgi:hypothetical protein
LGAGSLILIPLVDLPAAFFWGVRVAVALRFPDWVFHAPALYPPDKSFADSLLGDQVEAGIARIGMSPSNPGKGEVRLSKACIQIYQELNLRKNIELKEGRLTESLSTPIW